MFNNATLDFIFFVSILIVLFTFAWGINNEFYKRKKLEILEARLSQAGMSDIDVMNGIEFEQFLSILFKKLGIKVHRTQASNDFGADLILEGKERIVVQAKRYKKKVGIKAVQEINSAKTYYQAHEAWVITNNYFTAPAKELAESNGVKLIDRNGLADLVLSSKDYTQEVSGNKGAAPPFF
ncbi:restriction endonuclease [Bacillus marasmi]|uniref:restriction endonuclease n=1 Tax=Bacillus marasmi TaxID=1926279 RepID=UPI0011C7D455|nr:restriction endonuclease [Bacillus marasmi]